MMRTMSLWLLLSLLLLSILIHETQGTRLINNRDVPHKENDIHEKINIGVKEVIKSSKDDDSSGRIRKLGMIPTATISKNTKNEKNKSPYKSAGSSSSNKIVKTKDENMSVDPSSYEKGKPQGVPELNPDIVDVAGMDYSLASRKPPVHN